jgi:hypothetical protein
MQRFRSGIENSQSKAGWSGLIGASHLQIQHRENASETKKATPKDHLFIVGDGGLEPPTPCMSITLSIWNRLVPTT